MPTRQNLKMQNPSPNLDGPAQENQPSTLKNEPASPAAVQIVRPEPLKVLLEWKAPIRPFKKRNREYFTTIGAIAFLLIVILLLLQEWVLIAVIIALMFVSYIMGTVQPEETEHKITNRGIKTGGRDYRWGELGRFWFEKKWDQEILQVETLIPFPRRLSLLLGQVKEEEVKKVLSEYLLLEEPEKVWADRASDWISRRVPLETK